VSQWAVPAGRRRHFVRIRDCYTDDLYVRVAGEIAWAVACVIIGSASGGAQPSVPNRAADTCRVAPAAQLTITPDSIGPLRVNAPLAELLHLCPAAYIDTMRLRTYDTNPQAEPQVIFPFNDLYVSAIAAGRASAVDSTRPLHLWVIQGTGAWLPHRLRSNATWRELTAAYGKRGIVWVENDKTLVSFCAVRGLVFVFRPADYALRDMLEAHKWEPLELQKVEDPILPNAGIRGITFGTKRRGHCP
jgi:hypothetical protein